MKDSQTFQMIIENVATMVLDLCKKKIMEIKPPTVAVFYTQNQNNEAIGEFYEKCEEFKRRVALDRYRRRLLQAD